MKLRGQTLFGVRAWSLPLTVAGVVLTLWRLSAGGFGHLATLGWFEATAVMLLLGSVLAVTARKLRRERVGATPRLKDEIEHLPNPAQPSLSVAAKEVMRLHTGLAIREAEDLDAVALLGISTDIGGLYDRVAQAYLG